MSVRCWSGNGVGEFGEFSFVAGVVLTDEDGVLGGVAGIVLEFVVPGEFGDLGGHGATGAPDFFAGVIFLDANFFVATVATEFYHG